MDFLNHWNEAGQIVINKGVLASWEENVNLTSYNTEQAKLRLKKIIFRRLLIYYSEGSKFKLIKIASRNRAAWSEDIGLCAKHFLQRQLKNVLKA